MPGDFLENDLDLFLDVKEFASDIFWTPLSPSGATVTIQGIFDAVVVREDVNGGEFLNPEPQFQTKTSDIVGLVSQDLIQISGTATIYKVSERLDNGTGITSVAMSTGGVS